MAYTQSQIQQAETLMKTAMTSDEISNFSALSADDQQEYIRGFIENVREWKKEYLNQQKPMGGSGGGKNQSFDDGLRHWQSNNQQSGNNQQQPQGKRKTITDDIQNAKNAAENAQNDIKDQQNDANSSNGQNIADAAQQAAQSAQQAATSAQNAANAAAEASQNTNSTAAQKAADMAQDNADQSQESADRAQDLANEASRLANNGDIAGAQQAAQDAINAAKQAVAKANQSINAAERADGVSNNTSGVAGQQSQDAASRAAEAAQRAQEAAARGDLKGTQEAAQEAANAAQEAGQAAQQAGQPGQQAGQAAQAAAQKAQNAANNSQSAQQIANAAQEAARAAKEAAQAAAKADSEYQSSTQNAHSERNISPTLSDAQQKSSFGGKVSTQVTFSGNDVLSPEDYEKAKQIAERAGQPVDSDDYDSPEKTAAKKYNEAKRELRKWSGQNKPGYGNSPIDLTDTIDRLFSGTIDWTDKVREFMTAKANVGVEDVWAKKYMGLDPSHPKHIGRYLHPRERSFEKRSGIAEVFFLVDASGSMSFECGDGENVFTHIMSELIQLEVEERINKSAYAPFNVGEIKEEDVISWTRQDAPTENEIIEMLPMPSAGGGTSALDAVKSINELDDVYNRDITLLIIVTDGQDDYSQLRKVMTNDQLDKTIFLITNGSDAANNSVVRNLTSKGVEESHIITVNTETEWGASK